MRVVLLSAVAGRETGQIMTNSRKRHTPEQVVRKLGQADRMLADGQDVAAVCRELVVSEQTYYRWRNQYGGLKADDAKRLKELEKQNATLKRLLAEAELEKAALKELAEGNWLFGIRGNTVQLRVRAVVLGYASFWLGEAGF